MNVSFVICGLASIDMSSCCLSWSDNILFHTNHLATAPENQEAVPHTTQFHQKAQNQLAGVAVDTPVQVQLLTQSMYVDINLSDALCVTHILYHWSKFTVCEPVMVAKVHPSNLVLKAILFVDA